MSFVSGKKQIDGALLDPKIVKWVKSRCKGLGPEDLPAWPSLEVTVTKSPSDPAQTIRAEGLEDAATDPTSSTRAADRTTHALDRFTMPTLSTPATTLAAADLCTLADELIKEIANEGRTWSRNDDIFYLDLLVKSATVMGVIPRRT